MSEKRVLILLLVLHIIVFTLMGIGVMAENNNIRVDERNSSVFIVSKTSRTEALSLTADENASVSILFQHVDFHIIAKNNTSYKIMLDSKIIAHGVMNSSHIIVHKDFGETQGNLIVQVGTDIHNFHTVIIKNQLSSGDLGEGGGNYLKVSPSEFSWVQWKAGLGAFIASLIALPVAYLITKYYLERRGEYGT